ncbi:MAG: hypothetical protein NWF14_08015 [Candidatus Bathyarchaeota archaeon]|nr:hypothetical protein [Candidatus Bathyarchaeota archaeon]
MLYKTRDRSGIAKEILGVEKSEITTIIQSTFISETHNRKLTFQRLRKT